MRTMALRDFCGWTSPSNSGGLGSIPGRRNKIPHVSWPKNAAKKQYCNTFSKDLTKTKSLWHSRLVFFNNCQLGLVASGNLPGDPLPRPLPERLHSGANSWGSVVAVGLGPGCLRGPGLSLGPQPASQQCR